ncbi:MAG: hypothetical protein COA97_11900 [Flavobacteriales bacterium]|nr:MAG: hypothetical protein COA97_11900 [Flavobacteriales bacterium]
MIHIYKKNRPFLSSIALVFLIVFTSCDKTYDNTAAIIGKWVLISGDGDDIVPDFIWEFNENETYTIVNTAGKFEDDPFDSNPFKDKGIYTGGYYVNAPKGLVIREEYRSCFYFSAVNIKGGKMEMQFIPVNDDSKITESPNYVKLKFEIIK